jgi:NAD(P)-dependent dehydrogenase (short-subunit alcohol dehydrogenase family)
MSGIGRAVAIAHAREGADVLVCVSEKDDARQVKDLIVTAKLPGH